MLLRVGSSPKTHSHEQRQQPEPAHLMFLLISVRRFDRPAPKLTTYFPEAFALELYDLEALCAISSSGFPVSPKSPTTSVSYFVRTLTPKVT